MAKETGAKAYIGAGGLAEMVRRDDVDVVLAAIVGAAGLGPVFSAVRAGKIIALGTPRELQERTLGQSTIGIVCDQDPEAHVARLREYADAGYDRVTVQQVGRDQERFFRAYEERVLPSFAPATAGRAEA